MYPQTKTLARLLSPGLLFAQEDIIEVGDANEALLVAFKNNRCFAFQVGTQTVTEIDGETLQGKAHFGPLIYFGKVYTVDEIKTLSNADREAMGVNDRLITSLENAHALFGIHTRRGNWQTAGKGEKVYDSETGKLVFVISENGRPTLVSRVPAYTPA